KPLPPELKVKEYEFYKSVYCGLCRCMGKCTGCLSRLTLSYDFVFLALVRLAITGEDYHTEKRRCFVHPFKKRITMLQNESLSYCAKVSALLTVSKLRDDVADNKGFSRLLARGGLLFANAAARRTDLPLLEGKIVDAIHALSEVEKKQTASVDIPAGIFGEMLGEVFSFGIGDSDGSAERRIAREIGRHTGRWIYALDAADDIERDAKGGQYNPFLLLYDGDRLTDSRKEDIKNSLKMELYAVESAVNLIDVSLRPGIVDIIQNIIYLGMPAIAERVITKGKSAKNE
ncbi:MAG: hypothetical protein GX303_00005, partial [Clostridiales bacterium]|nr:hypothetical protein [Clostridiales bacterium]